RRSLNARRRSSPGRSSGGVSFTGGANALAEGLLMPSPTRRSCRNKRLQLQKKRRRPECVGGRLSGTRANRTQDRNDSDGTSPLGAQLLSSVDIGGGTNKQIPAAGGLDANSSQKTAGFALDTVLAEFVIYPCGQ